MALLADADVTLIHKDFAKSKGWQTVMFSLGVFAVLAVALLVIGEGAWAFIKVMLVGMVLLFGGAAGIDTKNFHKYLKEKDNG